METGDLTVFRCQDWLSKTLGDKKMVKELPAIVKGKTQIKGMSSALCTSGVGNLRPAGHRGGQPTACRPHAAGVQFLCGPSGLQQEKKIMDQYSYVPLREFLVQL